MKTLIGVLHILAATLPAVTLTWSLLAPLEIVGVGGALLMVFVAMVLAALFFAGLVALGNLLKRTK